MLQGAQLSAKCAELKKSRQIKAASGKKLDVECKNGHELSGDNLYYESNSRRRCRACKAIWNLKWLMKSLAKTADEINETEAVFAGSEVKKIIEPLPGSHNAWMRLNGIKGGILMQTLNINNKSKTHCKYDHPFSGDNLVIVRHGRACRMCKIIISATVTNVRFTNRRDAVDEDGDAYISPKPAMVKGTHEHWLKEFGIKKPIPQVMAWFDYL